jgi:hypothetical protein
MASVVPKPGRNPNWKIAHVIAIFRKGDNSLPSNYRPISLISCVGKIMERVIYKYVLYYFSSMWDQHISFTIVVEIA